MRFVPFQNLYQQLKISDVRLYEAFEKIQENIKNLFDSLVKNSYFLSWNLNADTQITTTAIVPEEGRILTILLFFLGIGGWNVVWGSEFGTVPALITTANTYSTLQFVGHNGRWWLVNVISGQVR